MTQAVTDIKELVGEMPARGCEWPEHECDSQAHWIARAHVWYPDLRCDMRVLALCDRHKLQGLATAARLCGQCCHICGLVAKSPGDIFGPVMPL